MRTALLSSSLLLGLSLLAMPAAASQPFPDVVKATVPGIACVPQCTLCHQTNPGMLPADKPFEQNMQTPAGGPGVGAQNVDQLRAGLAYLQSQGAAKDADGDTVGDYQELLNGTDPNDPDPTAVLCEVVPLYGCGASVAAAPAKRPTDPSSAVLAALTAVAGLLVMRRARR